ncbi:MAG: CBS domain-containing protein [Pseudomonadota bacterium]
MPRSFQSLTRSGSAQKAKTKSQTVASNTSDEKSTVGQLLEGKSQEVHAIRPHDTVSQAVQILRDRRIGALVVTDETGALQGILSERDIVRKLAETPGQTLPQTVAENMTEKVVTCAKSDLLIDVLRRMIDGRFRHMPVVEGSRLCGMVTIGDVVHHRLRELEQEALQLKQMIVG